MPNPWFALLLLCAFSSLSWGKKCDPGCSKCTRQSGFFFEPKVCEECRKGSTLWPCNAGGCVCADHELAQCGGAVSRDGMTTNDVCRDLCDAMNEDPSKAPEFKTLCQIEKYTIYPDKTKIDLEGDCLVQWVHGYSAEAAYGINNGRAQYGTIKPGVPTASQCQEECQKYDWCAGFYWRALPGGKQSDPVNSCLLKTQEMINRALGTSLDTLRDSWNQIPAEDERYTWCNMGLGFNCNGGGYQCLQCKHKACVYKSAYHISGPKFCGSPRDACAGLSELPTPPIVALLTERVSTTTVTTTTTAVTNMTTPTPMTNMTTMTTTTPMTNTTTMTTTTTTTPMEPTDPLRTRTATSTTVGWAVLPVRPPPTQICPEFGNLVLYFLMENRVLRGHELEVGAEQLAHFLSTVEPYFDQVKAGLGSFTDKPRRPGSARDYCFRHEADLTRNTATIVDLAHDLEPVVWHRVLTPGAQLDAILRAARANNAWESGQEDALKVAVILTSTEFHRAGDGLDVPRVLHSSSRRSSRLLRGDNCATTDFPTVELVKHVLQKHHVVPLFVTSPDVVGYYQSLVRELRVGAAVSSSAKEFDAVLLDALDGLCARYEQKPFRPPQPPEEGPCVDGSEEGSDGTTPCPPQRPWHPCKRPCHHHRCRHRCHKRKISITVVH